MNKKQKLILEKVIRDEINFVLLEQGFVQQLKQGAENVGQKAMEALINQFDSLVKKIQSYKSNSELSQLYKAIQAGTKQGGVIKLPQGVNQFNSVIQQWGAAVPKSTNIKENVSHIKISKKYDFLLKEATSSFSHAERLIPDPKALKEVADPVTISGIVLAAFKVVALVGVGLTKLGQWLEKSTNNTWKSLGKFCKWLGHIFHYAHTAEEALIDRMVPDRLSYFIYQWYLEHGQGEKLHQKYFKGKDANTQQQLSQLKSKEQTAASGKDAGLTYEQWTADKILRPKLETTIFQVYILFLFISALPTVWHIIHGFWQHGLAGALHGAHGSAVLATAEPTAAAVKAGELATGARVGAGLVGDIGALAARSIAASGITAA